MTQESAPGAEAPTWEQLDARLRELLELEPEAREQHLAALHLSSPALARRLARLLDASGRAAGLESQDILAGFARDTLDHVATRRVGQHFGAWELQELLGSGGMADVYLAARPIDTGVQRAAIKLVHLSGAGWSAESLVREAQVLARLSDPRIARLLDFGRSPAGEPWIAMEYVDGEPIDRWCRERAASLRDRVRLMLNVASAVDHAHRNLIVHRDIKPGNVFVSSLDGGVKLLDFGIARSLPGPGIEATRTALRAYTEAYASPEQLAGDTVAVASDIFQLGGLLYLLLCGQPAFADAGDTLPERLRAMEEGPVPPGRRARAQGFTRLPRSDIDLDTIVLKAMAFRPERRYLSARDFADDLRRWLDGEAISARRGRLYRLGRTLRRHWALAAVLALVVALAGTYVFDLREREALLEAQRARTERILDVAVEVLNESDPYVAGASRDLADASMKRIRDRVRADTNDDPEFRSRILSLLASVHARRGQNAIGLDMVREALDIAVRSGSDEALVAELALANARALQTLSRYDEALAVLETHADALRRHAHVPSQTVHARIEVLKGDADAASRRLEAVVAGLPRGEATTPDGRALLNQIAIVRGRRGDATGSIAAAEAAFTGFEPKTAREFVSWMTYAMNLAVAYSEARQHREALALHRRVSEWTRATLGAEHPQFLIVERSRADALLRIARFDEAYAVLREAAPAAARLQLPLHRVKFLRTRAQASLYSGRPEAAIADLIEAHGIATRELADVPSERSQVQLNLAWALFEVGAYAEAASMVDRSVRSVDPAAPRAAMLRLLLPALRGEPGDPSSANADRQVVASDHCLQIEFDLLLATIDRAPVAIAPELPATCEGPGAALAHALGARWNPEWLAEFPLAPYQSPLARRLLAHDRAPRPLTPELQAQLQQWRDAQRDEA
jgi:tetratricopeptide (TPR) repeat protein